MNETQAIAQLKRGDIAGLETGARGCALIGQNDHQGTPSAASPASGMA